LRRYSFETGIKLLDPYSEEELTQRKSGEYTEIHREI